MKKVEITKEEVIARAKEIRALYSDLHDVESIMNQAREDNVLVDEFDAVVVWGRLMRELPFKK